MNCYVYLIRSGRSSTSPVKIGMAYNPEKRLKHLQTGNPKKLELVMKIKCTSRDDARRLEPFLHKSLCSVNLLGEWFKVNRQSLYKVLKKLSKDPNCDIVEDINVNPSKLKLSYIKHKHKNEMISDMEKALTKRRKQVTILMDIIAKSGISHKECAEILQSKMS